MRKKKIASLCVISEAQTEVVRPQVRRGGTSCVMQNVWPDVKRLVPAQNKTIASQFMFFVLMSHLRCSVNVFLKGLIVELTLVSRGLPDRSFFFSLTRLVPAGDFIGHKRLVDV